MGSFYNSDFEYFDYFDDHFDFDYFDDHFDLDHFEDHDYNDEQQPGWEGIG